MAGDKNIFGSYNYNKVFIETGCYKGDGIQKALDVGFLKVISIEITPLYFNMCKERFKDDSRVEIAFGDSSKEIGEIIKDIDESITYWLDGHYSDSTTLHGAKLCPLMDELEAIKEHAIKYNDTILIDDRRCWSKSDWFYQFYQFTAEDIEARIKGINPKYVITYDDGYIPDDVIVAQIRN